VRRRDLLDRLDSHLERGNELMEQNREAFDRNTEAFERNREAFEQNREAFDRNIEAFDRNTEAFERNRKAFDRNTAAWHGAGDSLRAMGNMLARQVEILQDLQVEVRQQTEGLVRIIDRLDRLDGRGPGEEPAPG
jgi:hypothetical protein